MHFWEENYHSLMIASFFGKNRHMSDY